MFNAIAQPFGKLLLWMYDVFGSYGIALIAFAFLVRLIMLPFMLKSKKSSLRMMKLQPRIAELQRRYESNKQKLNEEMQRLYRQENIKPLGGCIWMLIPFPILIALYRAICNPLTIMMGIDPAMLEEGGAIAVKLEEMGFSSSVNAAYLQISQSRFITENFEAFAGITDKLRAIDYSFIGLNLGDQPQWDFIWNGNWTDRTAFVSGLILFLLPLVGGALTYLQGKLSSKLTANSNPEQEKQMRTMNLMMPLVTIWITFIMPSALGIYWIAGSVFSIVQDLIVNKIYGDRLKAETAEFMAREHAKEAELEAKRAETERLRAENATVVNKNTSKERLREQEKKERAERAAEYERKRALERGETPKRDPSEEPSRVGERRFARGRAYVEDRFTADAAAVAAATAAAEAAEAAAEADDELAAAAESAEISETAEAPVLTEAAEEIEPAVIPDSAAPAAEAEETESEADDFYGDDAEPEDFYGSDDEKDA